MKIGVFDSGLGGLIILKHLRKHLRKFDYVYLGDTKNLPYGDRSQKEIYRLTRRAVEYLFQRNCGLVILACNTASSQALRKLQREYLPKSKYKDRKILGVIRPTVEAVSDFRRIGIIGTRRTIESKAYIREIIKVNQNVMIIQKAAPKLVPMIEAGRMDLQILRDYLEPLKAARVETVLLGCTHYVLLKNAIAKIGSWDKIISQDDILPQKLRSYLKAHTEISKNLSQNGKIELLVTKLSPRYKSRAKQWFGQARLKEIKIRL